MALKTNIEWTEATWNPIAGCSLASPGCSNCYAMRQAHRMASNPATPLYHGTTKTVNGTPVWTGKVNVNEAALAIPLKRRKPTTFFVCSMSDLFQEDVPFEVIDRVFAVMALCPQHTFQIPTKRADRMREYVLSDRRDEIDSHGGTMMDWADMEDNVRWPLPNVWLGVSIEDQKRADERIPDLLATPAAILFVSCEPLLAPVDLTSIPLRKIAPNITISVNALTGIDGTGEQNQKIHWVIAGGESGPGSRPMHPDWARSLRDQCGAYDVPFFFKQWGNWVPEIDRDNDDPDWRRDYSLPRRLPHHYRILNLAGGWGFHGERVHLLKRVGKRAAGHMLDGVEHREMPR